MTTFLVTYSTRSGRKREMTLEASSPADARRSLRSRGILPTTLVRKEAGKKPQQAPARQFDWRDLLESKISIKEKALFASKLSAMVNAGVPIMRSLDLMRVQQKSPLFRRALTAMGTRSTRGEAWATRCGAGPRCSTTSASPWWRPARPAVCWMKR